jgi:hypothetical protein
MVWLRASVDQAVESQLRWNPAVRLEISSVSVSDQRARRVQGLMWIVRYFAVNL